MQTDSSPVITGPEAIAKIREIAAETHLCMFLTKLGEQPSDCSPMSIREVDDEGRLWFLSSQRSQRNENILVDRRVVLTVQNDSKYQYLFLSGKAEISTDRALIEKVWTPLAAAWFSGPDDGDISVVSVQPEEGHFWETSSGKLFTLAKMALAAVTGASKADEGVQGQLKLRD